MQKPIALTAILLLLLALVLYTCAPEITNQYEPLLIDIHPDIAVTTADKVREEVNVDLADGLSLTAWATDSLVSDPISISVAPDGRVFYTSATRQSNSEFDIRGHQDWMTASISFETVEDRRAFLRATFSADSEQSITHLKDLNEDGVRDWQDLAVEKENVWFVSDQSGNGYADRTQRYLEDFGEEITDVANGIEFLNGEVYIGVGPDLWRTQDRNADGTADATESLSHGYAVHIGFSGHGMSGVTVGPQGRIWWGIGDIGMNVVDKDGKHWKYPNRGVVVRCEPDGSYFEVFAAGVRNTHEFAFDQYGNLITVDNDGDHAGERERLVYLIDGSDSGWRINWQFGKYTDPKNNDYKVWMNEKMHLPRNDEQAAYFLPPIQNFVNGPTGLVYNPGTALSPEWYDQFFVAEFRGSPSNSPIHAFSMQPDGAGFALDQHREVVRGLLPTGIDFGPEGALYFGDWINGWGTKQEGRIWKIDVDPTAAESELRAATQLLLQSNWNDKRVTELKELLAHQDQRVRRNAQFELAEKELNGFKTLVKVAADSEQTPLARIHGIWGVAQMLRRGYRNDGRLFIDLLDDKDEEIVAQAAKMIGDLRLSTGGEKLIELLSSDNPRVQFFAMEALGRKEVKSALPDVIKLVRRNAGRDTWLRHGAMIALARLGNASALAGYAQDDSKAVKLACIVALRRMASPLIEAYLADEDEYIAAEAARAINDDYSIPEALPALAASLDITGRTSEPLLRRAINANLRVGKDENVDHLVGYAANPDAPESMRAEALATLAHWKSPSVFDRVDGRYRGEIPHDDAYARTKITEIAPPMMLEGPQVLRLAAIDAAAGLGYRAASESLVDLLQNDPSPAIRAAALAALDQLRAPGLENYLRIAMNDRDNTVRAASLSLLPKSTVAPAEASKLYADIIENGSMAEAQAALSGLAELAGLEAESLLGQLLTKLRGGTFPAPLQLDLVEAIESRDSSTLTAELAQYETELLAVDELGFHAMALAGGDPKAGYGIFYWNSTAQCTRCHAVFEYGGNVGPVLEGVADRLGMRELLTSVIRPSADLAEGYEVVLVTLNNEEMLSGIVAERTEDFLTLKVGKADTQSIPVTDIAEVETLPSSMPSIEGKLSRQEIRDLVAFLGSLRGEHAESK
ncbi:MAG: HEAT repeat domain-containing protein [Bacteroidota bacterium]